MPRIIKITPVESIKAGPNSTVLENGTILNPVVYSAADILFDDGIWVQVERPLTPDKVREAYRAARDAQQAPIDGIGPGHDVTP